MSAKWHVNSKGEPGRCSAETQGCPFGGETGTDDHFSTKEEARAFYESKMESNGAQGLRKGKTAQVKTFSDFMENIDKYDYKIKDRDGAKDNPWIDYLDDEGATYEVGPYTVNLSVRKDESLSIDDDYDDEDEDDYWDDEDDDDESGEIIVSVKGPGMKDHMSFAQSSSDSGTTPFLEITVNEAAEKRIFDGLFKKYENEIKEHISTNKYNYKNHVDLGNKMWPNDHGY